MLEETLVYVQVPVGEDNRIIRLAVSKETLLNVKQSREKSKINVRFESVGNDMMPLVALVATRRLFPGEELCLPVGHVFHTGRQNTVEDE